MALVGLLAAALTPLYGCGSECADGSTDQDGQCVVAAKGCAEGTKLQDGECRLDTTGCGEGTMFSEGACVPSGDSCTQDTTFDEATLSCVPSTEVLCGEGTEIGENGFCTPSAGACSDKTVFEDGKCVIADVSCGEGTEIDPNTGHCVLAAAGCAAGLAYDAESGTCMSTDEICEVGTKFDQESGFCLNDSCNLGDVLIDGVCITPAEDLAANADLLETENNDPNLGGTAEQLVVNPVGDDPYVFSGAIGEPTDLDADGNVDQDVDVFEFTAAAGEWFEVTVQSTGLQAPAFVVEGPNDFVRYSPMGRAQNAARTVAIPADGAYTVTVLPSLVLQTDGDISTIGSSDWTYVGTLEAISTPTPTDIDMSSGQGQLTGSYQDLSDNLFRLTNLSERDLVALESMVSSDADVVISLWEDTSTISSSHMGSDIEFSSVSADSTLLLVDWVSLDGPRVDFDLSATVIGSETTVTMLAGDSETFTVTAQQYSMVEASQTNPSSADLDVTITDSLGAEVQASAVESGGSLSHLADLAGDFTVVFTNNTGGNVDATLTAKATPPIADYLSAPGVTIPDGDSTGVSDTLSVSGCAVVSGVSMYIDITHGWRGDIEIDLTSPSGTTVRLWEDTGFTADDLIGLFPTDWTPANSLDAFIGENGSGDWTVTVYDDGFAYEGVLNLWGLNLNCQ
jgi:subtilisin-like proprotein convertase family protein